MLLLVEAVGQRIGGRVSKIRDLKARAYDIIVIINRLQMELSQINQRIAKELENVKTANSEGKTGDSRNSA